jgi:short-subunit dehydrogenase
MTQKTWFITGASRGIGAETTIFNRECDESNSVITVALIRHF